VPVWVLKSLSVSPYGMVLLPTAAAMVQRRRRQKILCEVELGGTHEVDMKKGGKYRWAEWADEPNPPKDLSATIPAILASWQKGDVVHLFHLRPYM